MRENFDNQLSKLEKMKTEKRFRLLDDMSTAFISAYSSNEHLDKSLMYVKLTRKALLSKGFSLAEIDDYLLEQSYISKRQINRLITDSIYMNDNMSIAPHIENRADKQQEKNVNDLIIDKLKSKPELLEALKRGVSRENLAITFNLKNTTLLKNFYEKHKEII